MCFCWIVVLRAILCLESLQSGLVWSCRIVLRCLVYAWQMARLSSLHRLQIVRFCLVVFCFWVSFSFLNVTCRWFLVWIFWQKRNLSSISKQNRLLLYTSRCAINCHCVQLVALAWMVKVYSVYLVVKHVCKIDRVYSHVSRWFVRSMILCSHHVRVVEMPRHRLCCLAIVFMG